MLLRLHPHQPESSELTVTCAPGAYSASAMARAVEDCDAHLLNLNVTCDTTGTGDIVVELRVSHRDGNAVARSLVRYGYTVTEIRGALDGALEQTARDRVNALLREIGL